MTQNKLLYQFKSCASQKVNVFRQILLLQSFKEKNRLSKIVRTCTQKNLPKHPHFQIPNGGLVMGGYSEGR